jgi:hypothetical protein
MDLQGLLTSQLKAFLMIDGCAQSVWISSSMLLKLLVAITCFVSDAYCKPKAVHYVTAE